MNEEKMSPGCGRTPAGTATRRSVFALAFAGFAAGSLMIPDLVDDAAAGSISGGTGSDGRQPRGDRNHHNHKKHKRRQRRRRKQRLQHANGLRHVAFDVTNNLTSDAIDLGRWTAHNGQIPEGHVSVAAGASTRFESGWTAGIIWINLGGFVVDVDNPTVGYPTATIYINAEEPDGTAIRGTKVSYTGYEEGKVKTVTNGAYELEVRRNNDSGDFKNFAVTIRPV